MRIKPNVKQVFSHVYVWHKGCGTNTPQKQEKKQQQLKPQHKTRRINKIILLSATKFITA